MRIALVCNDTQGGVQPYVALGAGLRDAGHDVRLVAPANFEKLARDSGLAFAGLSGGTDEQLADATAIAERGTLATMRAMMREMPRMISASARQTLAACEGVDLIAGGIGGRITGLPVSEKLGVPFVDAHLQPIGIDSVEFPGVLVSAIPRWLGRPGIRLSHHLTTLALAAQFGPAIAFARKAIGATASGMRPKRMLPVIYGFSRHVVPVPPSADRERHAVGYWTLPTPLSWTPSHEMASFLESGKPVVSIGFGSMGSTRPQEVASLVTAAAKAAGVRAIVLSGWARLAGAADPDILFSPDVPHEWLFPRMSAVVHHGGAGTTGAGLKAGVPSIIVPFGVDQPFWAGRVAALGAGPPPLPRRTLTSERLAQRISLALSDRTIRQKAAELGERIRAENGIRDAVDIFGRIGGA